MNWIAFSLDIPCLQRLVLKIGILVIFLLFSICINWSIRIQILLFLCLNEIDKRKEFLIKTCVWISKTTRQTDIIIYCCHRNY